MQIEEQAFGRVRVLRLHHPRLDLRSAADLKGAVAGVLASQPSAVVLDLSDVTFVDSTGLGAIVGSLKQLGSGELVLCGLNEAVTTLFKLTRMDKVFRCYKTANDALAALGASAR